MRIKLKIYDMVDSIENERILYIIYDFIRNLIKT